MADGFSAGDLYLNIGAVADDTIRKLDAIIERLSIINKGLGGITKTSKLSEITSSPKRNNKKDNSLGGLLNLGKWTAVLYTGRRLGRVFANIAQSGADFSETLNLWQVSMGQEFLPQATKFVNKLNEAYGISKETLMNSQAIFKNMLGSLGQISEQSAYALSEGITQMALDYASLYNVKFEDAMTKFQAALAGQVRPIRSVSGYDITENTLFQLYEQLGGTKTMRQLSRTEKQLLAIYAVFEQMERSGARGDLGRTLRSFANQSRIASENFKEILTYSGLIFTRWVQTTDLFQQLNGFLIFIGDVLEAVANTLPDIEVPNDPMADMAENAEQTNKEIDKIQGKLLDFDKFRSLNSTASGDDSMGLDQTLIDAFSKYETIFDGIDETSKKFAENLKLASGLFDENGVFNKDKWDELVDSITNVGIAIGISFGFNTITKIMDFATSVDYAKDRLKLLNGALDLILMGSLWAVIEGIRKGDDVLVGLGTTLGAITLAIKLFQNEGIKKFILGLTNARGATLLLEGALLALSLGFVAASFTKFINTEMSSAQRIVTILMAIATAASAAAVAFDILGMNWIGALSVAGLVAGTVLTISSSFPQMFANGGLPDKGTVFVAGEAGAEVVYNMPSGQSGVANVRQIAQATYAGTTQALNDWWVRAKGDMPQFAPASDNGLYERVTTQAGRRGEHWSN